MPNKAEKADVDVLSNPGSEMTIREYAAIHLKVPMSGNADLDAMIKESIALDIQKAQIATEQEEPKKTEDLATKAVHAWYPDNKDQEGYREDAR